ncbi:MAG: DUF1592 domain-containing protein [Bryobacteraceae bacterium]|nr:DUF1592 domain-containing protein [Bryobacteraceae bacterium]
MRKVYVPLALLACVLAAAAEPPATFKQYCYGCHGKARMGGLNLQDLAAKATVGQDFHHWQKIAAALEAKQMPPAQMPQPKDDERRLAIDWIRDSLAGYIRKHDGDPGRVTARRLTSAEYAYAVRDLTGVDIKFEGAHASDAAGGEGFTNFGDVQFMQEADLERFLENAKLVAAHAVIGAGPLAFYDDPGKSAFELSAIRRIQQIYQRHGFRAISGEGGKPYGTDVYRRAFYVAWQHRHGMGPLPQLAAKENVSPRFAQHIWATVNDKSPSHPTSEVVKRFAALPAPAAGEAAVRAACADIEKFVFDWPRWLFAAGDAAAGGAGDERALVINQAAIAAKPSHRFRTFFRAREKGKAKLFLNVLNANPDSTGQPALLWRNPVIRLRGADRKLGPARPLVEVIDEPTRARLSATPDSFKTSTGVTTFEISLADSAAIGGEIEVTAELDPAYDGDAVLRTTISDREEGNRGAPVWALLARPENPAYQRWNANVLAFAARLPQISHGEPTPSDKDPIPAPFNNTYNQPERDRFHVQVKYYRTDRFLVENMLDDATRAQLDAAWNDLLASFDYHDAFLRFVAEKHGYPLNGKSIAAIDVKTLPPAVRTYAAPLRQEWDRVQAAQKAAEPRHITDALAFAEAAWRRPLTQPEKQRLRAFYTQSLTATQDHPKALRALLARILVAPAFLYRFEPAPAATTTVSSAPARPAASSFAAKPEPAAQTETTTPAAYTARPLTSHELASRLSFFLWSSIPDAELRRAAAAGELRQPKKLAAQVRRMLADPKARRLATEFFGQWLGFYRFDHHRGVDSKRFPEFTEQVKAGMHEEAVAFFEHIVRQNRPLREIVFADYTFLNEALAQHYGIKKQFASKNTMELVPAADQYGRGGLLRLGAVLTATSAPLRTSPVKRGDWLLRRVLGTPTPPPPADAGTLPGDDKAFGGLTFKERLAAHQRNAACASCHSRIDPLGFPFEKYDAVGRTRAQYQDGKPIDDDGGVPALLATLKSKEPQIMHNFASKLIGYALGRTLVASDLPLIERMTRTSADPTFADMAVELVTSRQFLYRREEQQEISPR